MVLERPTQDASGLPAAAARFPAVIATKRLDLTPAQERDSEAFAALCNNPNIARMTGSFALPYLPETAAFFILKQPSDTRRGLGHHWTVRRAGELIGNISVFRGCISEDWEVGYWIGEPHWRQGYGTEALRAVVETARELGVTRLTARVFTDNPASRRLLERCGFVVTGRESGHCMARQAVVEGWRLWWQSRP